MWETMDVSPTRKIHQVKRSSFGNKAKFYAAANFMLSCFPERDVDYYYYNSDNTEFILVEETNRIHQEIVAEYERSK